MHALVMPAELLSLTDLQSTTSIETVEKPAFQRLMENVHMQGFRNPEE